jgi:hypothetical protein
MEYILNIYWLSDLYHHVLQMEGSTLKATVGRSTANVPVKAVLDIIQSPEKKSLWDKLYKSGYTLETLDDASGKYPLFCFGIEFLGIVCHFFIYRDCL